MMASTGVNWSTCPDHVILNILQNLPRADAYRVSLSCKSWFCVFRSPQMWRAVVFNYYRGFDEDKKQLKCIEAFGPHFRSAVICLDQFHLVNRLLAVETIQNLGTIPQRQIQKLTIKCTGENPLLYNDSEFLDALHGFFRVESSKISQTLTFLDLSQMPFNLRDELLYSLEGHFGTLEHLNVQNGTLVCQITSQSVEYLVTRCPKLAVLKLFHSCLSDSILLALADSNDRREPHNKLTHLSVRCRRQEKYRREDLSEFAWNALVAACPELSVTFRFDYTCPLWKVRQIMKPNIPVHTLIIETYTQALAQLQLAGEVYANSLKCITVVSQPSEELDSAITQLIERCSQLEALHVMCPLSPATIAAIFELAPKLLTTKQYTLMHHVDAFTWDYDKVLDEIRTQTGWPKY